MWVKQVIQLRNCLHCHLSIIISDSIISEQLTIVRTQLQLKSRFTCWAYRKKGDWRVCFQEKWLNEVLITITTCILLKITLVKFLNSCLNGIGETLIMVLLRNAVSRNSQLSGDNPYKWSRKHESCVFFVPFLGAAWLLTLIARCLLHFAFQSSSWVVTVAPTNLTTNRQMWVPCLKRFIDILECFPGDVMYISSLCWPCYWLREVSMLIPDVAVTSRDQRSF